MPIMSTVKLSAKYDDKGNMIFDSSDNTFQNTNTKSSKDANTQINEDDKTDELFVKGSEINKVDLGEMKKIIAEFRRYADVDIKKLRPYQSKRLNKMAYYVSLLYNHKESYMLMVSEIKKVFSNLTEVAPGTVGAYFYGCFIRTDFEETCSLICANSISPLARDSECHQRVVWAKYDSENDSYTFDETNKGINNKVKGKTGEDAANKEGEITYLYIENPKLFNGFTMSEKESLSNMGVEYVRLLGIFKSATTENLEENEYDNYEFKGRINDKYEYHDLARRKIKRDKLKTRYRASDNESEGGGVNEQRRKQGRAKTTIQDRRRALSGKSGRGIKNGRRNVNDWSQDNDDEEEDDNSVAIIGFSFFVILIVVFIVMFLKHKK